MITRRAFTVSSIASLACARSAATAQTVSGTAKLSVGFPAGGSIGIVARLIADGMNSYAPSIVVENCAGAGGRTVLEELKSAAADGSAMAITPAGMVTLFPHVYKKLGYDALTSLTPVMPVANFAFAISAGPMLPPAVRTLADLVGWCKSNPQKASYGSPGTGSLSHFLGEGLARASGAPLVHVSYKGGLPALQDVVAGHIPFSIATLASALPLIQNGQLRAIAVTSPKRNERLPEVQTIREAGFADFEATEWFGLFLPGAASAPVVQAVHTAVSNALKTPAVREGFAKQSLDVFETTPAEFRQMIKDETARWGVLVKASGFAQID